MFSKLDTSADLFLDQTELAAINLDKYEVCIRPFFNSCDTYKDGRVSTAEWCFCFWRESECSPWLVPYPSLHPASPAPPLPGTPPPPPPAHLLPACSSTSSVGAQGSQHFKSVPWQAPQ